MPQTTMLPARLVFGLSLLAGIAGAQTFPVSAPVAGRSVGQTGLASLSDVQVLDEYQAAAKALGISRRALLYKLQRLRKMGCEIDPT